ncbi:MAG TPA: DUF6629 family protein [Acidimicrobiales bacterium]|nr:DUF6629 family protein [Acidimicrobiales bacterium]
MCFSPQADLVGGAVISGIGVDALRHVDRRASHVALASLPVLFGAHQLVEAVVWFSLQGHLSHGLGRGALWVYLGVAFVVLPIFVPIAVAAIEPSRWRKRLATSLAVVGTVVGAVLLAAMVRGPMTVAMRPYHLAYGVRLSDGWVVAVAYVLATCGAALLSSDRRVVIFGVANLIAVALIARLTIDGFASVWCAWAAVISAAIALQMRCGKSRRPAAVATS